MSFRHDPVFQSLRKIQKLELQDAKTSIESLLPKVPIGCLDRCRKLLWRILIPILESHVETFGLVQLLWNSPHFSRCEVFWKLLDLPRDREPYRQAWIEQFFLIFQIESFENEINAANMMIAIFDRMNRNEKARYVTPIKIGVFVKVEVFDRCKSGILESMNAIISNADSENEKIIEVLEDISCLFGNYCLVRFMVRRLDCILSEDTVFAIRYAKTLLNNNSETSGFYQTSDPNISEVLLENLDVQLSKFNPEFDKLQLAFDLVNSFVDFKSINFEAIDQKIEKMNELGVLKVFNNFKENGQTQKPIPMDGVYTIENTRQFLIENKEKSARYLIDEINNEVHLDNRIARIVAINKLTDSFTRFELHDKLLQCFRMISDEYLLSHKIHFLLEEIDCIEMLNYWFDNAQSSHFLFLAAKFIPSLGTKEGIIKVVAKFLMKINFIDLFQAMTIRAMWEQIKTVLENVGDVFMEMEAKRGYSNWMDDYRFVMTIEKLSKFLERKDFIKVLLVRIDLLFDPDFKTRYALTLAQCGFDEQNRYQINPATSRENDKIVEKIFKYLCELHPEISNRATIEVAVQIFKNFVDVDVDDFWVYVDLQSILWLKNWARQHLTRDDDVNLRQKINDIFETNKSYSSQPSFGTNYEVVSQRRALKFFESDIRREYFVSRDPL